MLAEFIQLPKEGDTVGPFLLRHTLSTSILGAFYQATHRLKHENLLIHIVPEALLRADSRFQQRYQEAIAKQTALGRGPAMGAIEMERIGGNLVVQYPAGNYKSLNEVVIGRPEPLPEDRVQELLMGVGKGLMEAAKIEQGHYFMSPDFLFLNENGELRIAGIGLFQSIQYECFERFVSGAVIPISGDKKKSFNALEILSPEIRNFKSRDARSDFYCIGMCAYFILTGSKPERRWATPTKARKEIKAGWDLFISKCLEPKPADRFPNYKTFLRDLEYIDDLEKSAQKDGRKFERTLKIIPLPKALENVLSLRFLLFVRLIFLGLAGVMAIGTASLFYQIIFSDFETEVHDDPIRRVLAPEQANLTLMLSPENALVVIRGPESGRFNPNGKPLYLKGKSGRYTVKVTAPRHRMIVREIDLIRSKPVQQNFNLTLDFASVRVRGAVGTEVYVMPEEGFLLHVGTIDESDGLEINKRLLRGEYRLVGLHPSLLPALTEPLKLTETPVEVTFTQPPRPTELLVDSDPSGASVFVNGALLGLTPLKVEGLDIREALELRVEKAGYRSVYRDLFFDQGERILVETGPMELRIGTLRYAVDLSIPDAPDLRELMLTIDGQMRTAMEHESFELTEGSHLVSLEHPDYFPLEKRITVVDQQVTDLILVLEPRPLRLWPILNTDAPVRFQVDGVETPLSEYGYLPVPANQTVKVEAIIRDYLTVSQGFKGSANERLEWEVPLKPIPGPVKGADWAPPYFNLPMTWLAPVKFTMGSPINEFRRLPNEDSLTKVELTSGFWIGLEEVTQDLYLRVMGSNPSQFKGDDLPVDSISWEDANAFCSRLSDFEAAAGRLPDGYVYRLPTEAEWEYAARAGTLTAFSFGSTATPREGNFHGTYSADQISGKSEGDRYGTMPPGSFPPNAFGLVDVHGNVAEWTLDRFWDRHPGGSVVDPINKSSGRGYAIKGGSWRDSADRVRTAAREGAPGTTVRNSIGFRVVLAREIDRSLR